MHDALIVLGMSTIEANDIVMIGLSDALEEGTWVWSDGSPLDYVNWVANHPTTDPTKYCVLLHNTGDVWGMQEFDCNSMTAFVIFCSVPAKYYFG